MSYEDIRYEVEDGRARITLDRPQSRNAITSTMLRGLEQALWEADDDTSVHCVILRGEGPSFCSGYDLTGLALELMGAQTLQRLAAENDARAHRSQAVRDYGRSVRDEGLRETLRRRDEPFGDGYARVGEPEGRLDRGTSS